MEEEAKTANEDKASVEGELAKAKAENTELWTQLKGPQDDLQTVQRNSVTLNGQVISLEKQQKEAEEKLHSALEVEAVASMSTIMKARQKVVIDVK